MLSTMTKHQASNEDDAPRRGRKPNNQYRARITVGVDLSRISLSEDGNTVQLEDKATIPPLLEAYAHENGERMPDGLYGFFGDDAELALKKQIDFNLATHKGELPPIWDMVTTLEFEWRDPENHPRAATMAWKDPRDLQGAFIRIGRISGETNDILRFYTGDRLAVDRLTLEPWRVDEYAAALKQVYGTIRAVIFNAKMADESIQTIVKVYDRTLFEEAGLRPLYRWLSSQDPSQAQNFELPEESWKGWGVPSHLISPLDIADLMTFVNQPRSDKKTREILTNRRIRALRDEGRFPPRHKEIKALSQYRKPSPAKSSAKPQKGEERHPAAISNASKSEHVGASR